MHAQGQQQPPLSCWQWRMHPLAATAASARPGFAYASRAALSTAQPRQCSTRAVAMLAPAPIDPNAHRVIETELTTEAEQSYLAVGPAKDCVNRAAVVVN